MLVKSCWTASGGALQLGYQRAMTGIRQKSSHETPERLCCQPHEIEAVWELQRVDKPFQHLNLWRFRFD